MSAATTQPIGRLDTQCDGCQLFPFVGPIFCSTRVAGFVLCTACGTSGKWTPSHGPFDIVPDDQPASLRSNATCNGCSRVIDDGVGFVSTTTFDFALCRTCEGSQKWTATHGPFERQQFLSPDVRFDAQCDGCQMFPFVGTLFSSSRVAGFVLCAGCHRTDKWQHSHGPFNVVPPASSHVVLDSQCDGCSHMLDGVGYVSTKHFNFHLCVACERSGKWMEDGAPFLPMEFRRDEQRMPLPKAICHGCDAKIYTFVSKNAVGFTICGACDLSGKYELLHGPFHDEFYWTLGKLI
ncbi:Aste57867_12334 [Aphanomyces stellatus]|uniref:Aste57867_12334 protein n=1 Tax=Aphanomyces stellatus TaxID=120398 RepID=A0A485KVW9_9STRA|nr:hypothetical protein As57867_012288 [Aphanomyces stellatus]VFT89186.1 Aste57867_12334 [Aphanomyces stellatus]